MNNNLIEFVLKITIVPIIIIIAFVLISDTHYKTKYNNGICHCGGHLIYQEAVGNRNTTSYIFKCDECGEMSEYNSRIIKDCKIYYEEDRNTET